MQSHCKGGMVATLQSYCESGGRLLVVALSEVESLVGGKAAGLAALLRQGTANTRTRCGRWPRRGPPGGARR